MHLETLLQIYAFDVRYSVPHWRTIEADPARADTVAREILANHTHYRRIDIWLEDKQLITLERQACPAA